jgi:hypothetical protein
MNIKKIDGYPVVDATEPLFLEIKSLDVGRGEAQTPDNCAIARACKRTLQIIEARVHLSRTYLRTSDGEWLRYLTPDNARTEMIAFDRGAHFEPGEYRFPPPPKSKKLGGKHKTGPKTAAGKKRPKHHTWSNVRAWK